MKRSIITSLRNYIGKVFFSTVRLILPVLVIVGMLPLKAESRSLPLPVVKVRFANFDYSCATKTMCVDVEFQCDSAMKQMFLMNVRFFYDDSKLEFKSFGEFAPGYGPVDPDPPVITTGNASSGPALFRFSGPAEYVNGSVKRIAASPVYISDEGWTKLFNVCFTVEDPAPTSGGFCPSLVWDLEEDPTQGGFLDGNEGVVITLAVGADSSTPCAEEVVQYNWAYDGIPGTPYGMPDPEFCIVDNIPPTLTPLPDPTTIECPAVPNFSTPTATDDCSTPVLTSNDVTTPGVCAQEYSITRTWKATDDAGNTATVSQTFHITDNTPPTISTLPVLNPVECPQTPTFTTPTASDLCDPEPRLSYVDNTTPGACPQEYVITRTWTATDACGNSATASQSVSITDNTAPVITLPETALTLDCFNSTVVKAWTDLATATDACSGSETVTASFTPPADNCNETVLVTFTATDNCGNTGTSTKSFTVDNNEIPTVIAPTADLSMECFSAGRVSAWAAAATATDHCGVTLTVTPTYTAPADNCDETVTVTFTATDACGNTGTTTKSFTVDDNTPPVITPPVTALTLSCFDAAAVKAWTDLATANDACSGAATVTANYTPPGDNCEETVIVTFTATDACGNTGSTTKSFTVDDNTPPVVNCPQIATSYQMDTGQEYYTAQGTEFNATANDACGLATLTHNLTHTSSTTLAGYQFPTGRTTVTWTATDNCGNTAVCSFTVVVSDEQPPVLNCPPAPTNIQCAGDLPVPFATWTEFQAAGGSASDNEGVNYASFTYVGQVISDQTCPNRFIATRTYRIADNTGLTDVCTQAITVNDVTPPVVTAPEAALTMSCYNAGQVTTWAATASATDNCGGTITVTPSYTPPADNCDEVITVTFIATDACGNTGTTTKSFTVDDNTPPVVTAPPATLTMSCFNVATLNAWLNTASAEDNCGGQMQVIASYDQPADNCDESITVTFTATDACGNTGSTTKSFTVDDNTPPVITPPVTALTISCFDAAAVKAWTDLATANDACSGTATVTATYTPPVNNCDKTVTVTFTATDACGNTGSTTKSFTVDDNTPPVVTAPPAALSMTCFDAGQVTTWAATASATDNCGGTLTVTPSYTPPANNCDKTVTVTFTATDACGNTGSTTKSFAVDDNTPPVVTAPPAALTMSCFNVATLNGWLNTASAEDNCGGQLQVIASYDQPADNCDEVITVTFTATDACGNTGSTTKSFTVDDNTPPVVTAPAAALTMSCFNVATLNAWLNTASAEDNCGGQMQVIANYDQPADNCDEVITVTFTATDACGNTGTTTKSFAVDDNTPPVVTAPPATLAMSCFNVATLNAWLNTASAQDNCGGQMQVIASYDQPADNCDESITVTFTATDACGNTGSTTKSFTVDDNTPPVVNCPQVAGSYLMDAGQDYYTTKGTEFNATANDVCGLATLTHNLTHTSSTTLAGYQFPTGRTTVTWTATDICGNTASCSFVVNVSDEQAPELNCPPAPTGLQCAGEVPAPLTTWTAFVAAGGSATDNEGINEASFTYLGQEVTNQTCINRFTLTRTYRIADNSGLTDVCTQTITVNDITPPLVTAPPATLELSCFDPAALNAWLNTASAADNCGGQIPVIANYAQPNDNCDETVIVTFTATDACGNTGSTTKSFTVDDNTPPVITPSATALNLSCFDAAAVKAWTDLAIAIDACSGAETVTASYTPPADNCNETVTVTFTATDNCGNTGITTRNFTVNDITPPTVTCPQIAASYQMDAGEVYYTAQGTEFNATASDVCGLATLTHNLTHTSSSTLAGYRFPTGSTAVTWTATDNCGNTAVCSFTVVVSDEQPPVLNCPPAPAVLQCAGEVPPAYATWTEFTTAGGSATDNDGINPASFTYLGQVITNQTCTNRFTLTRTYRIADNTGLTDVCTQTITVNDITPPLVIAPPATLAMECFNVATLNAWLNTASAEDNCGGQMQVIADYDLPADNCDEVITVTFTATDECGNTGSTTKSFTVDDNVAPVIACPDNQTFTLLPGQTEYGWNGPANPLVSDNCTAPQNIILAGGRSDGRPLSDPWPAGETAITWNAEDACGNVAEPCIQVITVGSVYADLQVEKTVSNLTPAVNELVAFTLLIVNNGPLDATGVAMTDILPSGYTYVSDNSGGSFNPETGSWLIGNMAVGLTRSLVVNASVNEAGDYLNEVVVTGNQPDPNIINNRDSVIITPNIIPQFLADTIFTCQDMPASGLILDGITGIPPGPWSFPADSITGPFHGELIVSDEGVYDYFPAPGYFGMDTAMVQICNETTCLTDTMLFLIYEQIIADAGPDIDLCGATSVQLHSLEYPGATVQWFQADGPSMAVFNADTIPSPVISELVPGTYIFELFMTNGLCFANDDITVTIWEPPVAMAGDDATMCSSEGTYHLNGMGVNAMSVLWITTGTGTFDDPSLPDAVYTPSEADIEDGQVQLILTAEGYLDCASHTDFMVLSIWKSPKVYAGRDAFICSGSSYQVNDAWAADFKQVSWTHNGAGTLEGAGQLVPTYISGSGETGKVTLVLTAVPMGGVVCPAVTDTMVIDISTVPAIVCPISATYTFNATPGRCGYLVPDESLDAHVSGACGNVAIKHDFLACGCSGTLAGSVIPVGTTVIEWVALDDFGFADTCRVTIHVIDNIAPEFVNCPSGKVFTVGLFSNECTGGTIWSIPVARDNCSDVTVTQVSGPAQGTIMEPGQYNIVYEATDASGNKALCSFTINMIDTEDPILVCPQSMVVASSRGTCTWASPPGSLSLMWADSNCPFTSAWEVTNPDATKANGTGDVSGYIFQPGVSWVKYVITETSSGKSASCTFSVTVIDTEKPVLACPAPLMIKTNPGECDAAVTLVLPTMTDNCQTAGAITYKVFGPDNSIMGPYASTALSFQFMKGISQVEWTVTDLAGNVSVCHQQVTVWTDAEDLAVSAGPDEMICEGEEFTVAGSSATNVKFLAWTTSGSGIFGDKTILHPVYHPSAADILNGMVRLTLTGSSDCASATDEMVLTITGYPAVDAGPDVTLCHGEVLYITEAKVENVASLTWVTSGTGTLANAATLHPTYTPSPTESGILRFILTGTGMGGCGDITVKDTMYVSIVKPLIVKASDDLRILSGRTTLLSVEVTDGSGFYSYLWTPEASVYTSNTNRTETMPLTATTQFIVTVTDDITGCSAKDTVVITTVDDIDDLITIYNGVSPNGDGANDVWLIDGIELFPDNEAMIFNRWGDEIKTFKAYDNIRVAWDATNKQDKPVPDGTYYYVLKIRDIKTYTGWIQVKSGF